MRSLGIFWTSSSASYTGSLSHLYMYLTTSEKRLMTRHWLTPIGFIKTNIFFHSHPLFDILSFVFIVSIFILLHNFSSDFLPAVDCRRMSVPWPGLDLLLGFFIGAKSARSGKRGTSHYQRMIRNEKNKYSSKTPLICLNIPYKVS